ncbi:MAG: nucleotidyltransferase family protein [Terracidiphilus sp.]
MKLAVNWDQLREQVAMRPSEVLPKHRETIRQLVLEAGMANPRVFGSALRGNDEEGSDLDLLVDPAPKTSLLDVVRAQRLIETLVQVRVDLLTPGDLPPKFRDRVVAEATSL